MAHGQLAFAQHLWPYLRPCYGYIDENGRIIPGGADAVATKVKSLLWANFFGPPYVERLGRDFLLDAPGWKVESLPGGGILYVISSSFTKKGQDVPTKDVEAYFRQRVPRVRLYQPKPLPDY